VSDLINREEAIDTLNIRAELLRRVLDDTDIVGAERAKYEWGLGLIESYISDMEELPSAEPVRHGTWEMKPDPLGFFDEIPVCSECGCTTTMREKTKYCPHCGARMDADE
jgi:hypothetical protein